MSLERDTTPLFDVELTWKCTHSFFLFIGRTKLFLWQFSWLLWEIQYETRGSPKVEYMPRCTLVMRKAKLFLLMPTSVESVYRICICVYTRTLAYSTSYPCATVCTIHVMCNNTFTYENNRFYANKCTWICTITKRGQIYVTDNHDNANRRQYKSGLFLILYEQMKPSYIFYTFLLCLSIQRTHISLKISSLSFNGQRRSTVIPLQLDLFLIRHWNYG